MIIYDQFWITLKESSETTYTLIHRHHISSATIDKLRKGKSVTTTTLHDLYRILSCSIEQILTYVPSDNDQTL